VHTGTKTEAAPATVGQMDLIERFEVKAPEGAPNVILVLVDDLGFAGTSAFGGPVSTPTFDRLASEGIFYNNFHTTAVCSPTRAAIKSGRNHHVNNMAFITEMATGFPGGTGEIPQKCTRGRDASP
jgi:arylsulfatase A-like enzyme